MICINTNNLRVAYLLTITVLYLHLSWRPALIGPAGFDPEVMGPLLSWSLRC